MVRLYTSMTCAYLDDMCLTSSITFYECPAIIIPKHTPKCKKSRLIKA